MLQLNGLSSPARSALHAMRYAALAVTLGLPPALVRPLAGPPRRDGDQVLSPNLQLMLRLQRVVREPVVESLPILEGRVAMRRQARLVAGRQRVGSVRDLTVKGADGSLDARLYTPTGAGTEPGALLVFFHGGGMIYGDLDSHDGLCRFLCERAGVRVLAVAYRLAPEHPFPAGVEDAWAAYEWLAGDPANAADLGADPARLAVGGDSAGAYLSAVTAMRAAEAGLPLALQLLIYPVTDFSGATASRRDLGSGLYLTAEFMRLAEEAFLGEHDRHDPRVSVIHADVPEGLAPAHVVTAHFDPLRDEGESYADRLEAAGVPVTRARVADQIHGFANMVGPRGAARRAMLEVAAVLREGLRQT